MKLKVYQKYKSSGVDLFPKIPDEWKVRRLKDLGWLQNGVSNDASYFGEGTPFVSYGNVYNDTISAENIKTLAKATEEDKKLYSVKENDIFFTRTSETVDEIGFSAVCMSTIADAVFSGFVIRFRPYNNLLNKRFSKYYFQAHAHRNFFVKEMNIVTRASLNQGTLSNLPVLIPEIKEQVAIANYLDKEVESIDKKVSLFKKKREKLGELKQSLINKTITQGLGENLKFKNSNIEWVGKIPDHWSSLRGKDVFSYKKLINRGLVSKNVLSLTYGGVINKDFDTTAGLNPASYETYQLIKKDDLVFKLIDLDNIKTSRVGIVHEDGIMSSAYIRLIPKKNVYSRYFYYLYFYYYKINLFNFLGGGVRSTLSYSDLLEIPIILPSYEEQKKIVSYLDKETKKIDLLLNQIKESISVHQELRKTLVNDVVTGKVKVT